MDFLFFLSLISLLHAGCLVPLMCFYSGQMIESCTGGQRFILELKRLMSLLYWRTSILPVEISPTHKKFTEITSRFRCFILNPSLMSNHRSLQSPHLYVLISSLSVPSKLQHYYGCDHNDSLAHTETALARCRNESRTRMSKNRPSPTITANAGGKLSRSPASPSHRQSGTRPFPCAVQGGR